MAYREQFERARRSLQKLQQLSALTASENITLPSHQQDEYVDALYHYFQDCWHLKDWVKNDDAAPADLKSAVRRMESAQQNEEGWIVALMLCADVANGSKHFRPKGRLPRLDAKTQAEIIVKVQDSVYSNPNDATVAFRYSIVTPDKNYDALEVAQQGLAEWEKLITTSELSSASSEVAKRLK